jgi:hypothetical protein
MNDSLFLAKRSPVVTAIVKDLLGKGVKTAYAVMYWSDYCGKKEDSWRSLTSIMESNKWTKSTAEKGAKHSSFSYDQIIVEFDDGRLIRMLDGGIIAKIDASEIEFR